MKRDPNCTRCRLHEEAKTVCLLGESKRRKTDVMVVGEAPGKKEDETGRPFVGAAGRLLREALITAGVPGPYFTNAVHCRPPDNRAPKKGEITKCKAWLDYEVERVKPRFVLLLGNIALESVTGKRGIKQKRGRPFEKNGILYMPTFHPALTLRDPKQEATFRSDLEAFADIVHRGKLPEEEDLDWTIVDTWDKVKAMIRDLKGTVSFDLETSGLNPWMAERRIVSLGLGTRQHQWCVPIKHKDSPWTDRDIARILRKVDRRIRRCLIVAHNAKFDTLWMWVAYGYRWDADFDTMLAHHLLDENNFHGLKILARMFYGAPDWEIDKDEKQGDGDLYRHCKYLAHDVFYTRKLRFTLGKRLKKDPGVYKVWKYITMPCVWVYTEAQYNGVYVDVKRMDEVEEYLNGLVREAEEELDKWAPGTNWNSPKQVAKVLFEDMGFEVLDKTKGGAPSTSESVLLRIEHPITDAILKWKGATKNLSTFINGWRPYIDEHGYLHPNFKLHGTVTGRPSCEKPNLQQTPRDTLIRSLIIAPEGWELIEADLSQAELRVAGELSGDPALVEAYLNGKDVHWKTAVREVARGCAYPKKVKKAGRRWYRRKVTYDEGIQALYEMGPGEASKIDPHWKWVRKKAKATNFGYLYGMWWKKFKTYARDNYGITLSDREAQESRQVFFDLYRQLPHWHKRQQQYARRNGYVRALSGRVRRLPDAQLPYDCPARGEAWRQAINSPVQGFASDINLLVVVQLRREFEPDVVRVCGTVHDAILVRVRKDYVPIVYKRILEIMRRPDAFDELGIEMKVPMEGEAEIGPWSKGVELKEWQKKRSRSASRRSRRTVSAGENTTTGTLRN